MPTQVKSLEWDAVYEVSYADRMITLWYITESGKRQYAGEMKAAFLGHLDGQRVRVTIESLEES